ncbi:MAG: hypothetical protein Q7K28_00765 [Candidatus Wildermuthbacteria bacterium]|nr:hypothetical protein [Candidatus Wildermuthbacteria bacterium]
MKSPLGKLLVLALFGIAMGLLEAITVVYIREIVAYRIGASYQPLTTVPFPVHLERIREGATIVMLLAIGFVSGNNFRQRLAYFLYVFGIWDILYYIGLRIFLGWPVSIFSWDTLFYIPQPWRAPVLVPVICSILLIFIALAMVYRNGRCSLKMEFSKWALVIIGLAIISFTFFEESTAYSWKLFGVGLALLFFSEALFWKKTAV